MAYVVVYDACVLHDPAVRDLLVRLATKDPLNLRARWSEQILDEMDARQALRDALLEAEGWAESRE